MEKETKLNGAATEKQIAEWKEKHGKIFTTTADGHIGYFRKPNRRELSYALSMQNKPLEMTESLLKSCFVGGSRVFIDDLEYSLGCEKLIDKLVSLKTAEVGEL